MLPLVLCAALALSPDTGKVVTWSFTYKPAANGTALVEMTAHVGEGWHIYATKLENDLGPIPTTIRFTPSGSYTLIGPVSEPVPEEVFDPNFEMQVRYHSGDPLFTQLVRANGKARVTGEVEFMACNDKTCLPPEVVTFSLDLPTADVKP